MKLIGEIFGGVLVVAFLAFKAGWLDAGTVRSLAVSDAPEAQAAVPHPWASNAPDPEMIDYRAPIYYPNCAAARASGAVPIYRGEPGYRPALDRDGDGVACEPYRGRR